MNSLSDPKEKIELFMALFKGRDDVYAKRWQNKKGMAGYSPVCLNEWKPGICSKPKIKCADCTQKVYEVLDEKVIENHLKGNIVAGIYPMCLNETCYSLAIDFDDEGWRKDISVLRDICMEFAIPIAVERSRSGNGAHAWFFFENQISAALARKFGTALLTYSMSKRHEITFKSYDRLFPNQDTMPKGGLGNLIAFKKDDEEVQKPWETNQVKLLKNDFPPQIQIVRSNMLLIAKPGISQRALNYLKRLAAFNNPEFYKAQAMRMPTFNKPRIISCSDETEEYLCLPRGCEADLNNMFRELEINVDFVDETNSGRTIEVEFKGSLRDEQPLALNELLKHDNGVLSGTTAFGKTVVAIKLIAERKVNTLILVDRVNLVLQWKERLTDFLTINETLPDTNLVKKRAFL